HNKHDKPALEYIWTIKCDNNDNEDHIEVQSLYIGKRKFLLKVKWRSSISSQKEATIQWPYADHYVTPVRHACEALEYIEGKRGRLSDYERQLKLEEMLEFTSKLVWKFIDNKPEMWKLMGVRYDVMSNLVMSDSNSLIKYILFGN